MLNEKLIFLNESEENSNLNLSQLLQDKNIILDGEEEENGEADHEQDFMENGRDGLTGTPDSANSRNDKELDDLMDVEPTPKTCIMHALSIVSAPASHPGSSPPPLAADAPLTENGDAWKPQGHTTKLEQQPY
ncbi:hypothetical protein JTB14_022584 [Gonioctena quinquepunctata]|nr:hypothetical protein JTB14_022584 [Gonioctena quinquepunctata]